MSTPNPEASVRYPRVFRRSDGYKPFDLVVREPGGPAEWADGAQGRHLAYRTEAEIVRGVANGYYVELFDHPLQLPHAPAKADEAGELPPAPGPAAEGVREEAGQTVDDPNVLWLYRKAFLRITQAAIDSGAVASTDPRTFAHPVDRSAEMCVIELAKELAALRSRAEGAEKEVDALECTLDDEEASHADTLRLLESTRTQLTEAREALADSESRERSLRCERRDATEALAEIRAFALSVRGARPHQGELLGMLTIIIPAMLDRVYPTTMLPAISDAEAEFGPVAGSVQGGGDV